MSNLIASLPAAFPVPSRIQTPIVGDDSVGPVLQMGWSQSFTSYSWGALILWVVMLFALQAITWPLVRRMFTRLPDRGWAFARPISIMLGGLIVWFPASFGIVPFSTAWSIAAMIILAVVCWLIVKRVPVSPGEKHWRNNSMAVTAEWVFWIVFFFFVLLRAINPDSWHMWWGGEKPMEFAHLNAILRSESMPPHDPWYAGGILNYYYFGTFLVANLIQITGIPPEIAFNLATPLFPAMLSAAVFSLGATFGKRLTASNFGGALSGLAGVFFVQFAGNFIVTSRLWSRAIDKVLSPEPFVYWVWEPTRSIPVPALQINITEFPYFGALYADLHPHIMAMPYTIVVIALAWQIAASWRTIPLLFVRKRLSPTHQLEILAPIVMTGIVIGVIWMTNAWDMPLAVIIAALGLTMMTIRVPSLIERIAIIVGGTAIIGIIAFITAYPFNRDFRSVFGDLGLTTDSTPLLALESHVGVQLVICTLGAIVLLGYVRKNQVENGLLLQILGGAAAIGLILQWISSGNEGMIPRIAETMVVWALVGIWSNIAWQSADEPNDFNLPISWLQSLAVAAMTASVILVLLDREVLALYLGIGLSAAIVWAGLERQSARFVAALIAGATLLGAALEIVYLVDDLDGSQYYRMNTIFKFYNQIWNLFGIACGVIIGIVIWRLLVWEEPINRLTPRPAASQTGERAIRITAAIALPLMALLGTYMLVATPIRLDQRFGDGGDITLNAYSWMEYGEVPMVNDQPLRFADDLEAINWMNENIDGAPVLVEASFGTYRCNGSRMSINTGLPAVIGWVRHERQQRTATDLDQREREVREFYTDDTADATAKREFLDTYNVEYVVVGQMERQYPSIDRNDCISNGNPAAIETIDSMEGSDLEVVFQNETTTIYRVIRDSN